ncbi:sulfotransferase [Sphaerothrix gracilis]|uniref:sulfotransferase n=1 Tax=Sphaerothrix gracilis TaxID=3151835 RepID=UPI0031FC3037
MQNSTQAKQIIITGRGRSGTNWLMDTLDASPLTHCRSEPYVNPASPLSHLTRVWETGKADSEIASKWDNIVHLLALRMSVRDHHFKHPKFYIRPLAQHLKLPYLLSRPKLRKTLGIFMPSLRGIEWKIPTWIASQSDLEDAYTVLKVNFDAFIIQWILENRTHASVLHIVRHPGGRLNSWMNRFLSSSDAEHVLNDYKKKLKNISDFDESFSQKIGNIDSLSLIQAELWMWRYINESIYLAANMYPNYRLVVYEDFAENPVQYAKELYEHCSLPWNEQIEKTISDSVQDSVWGRIPGTSKDVANAWKQKLNPEYAQTVSKVLQDSLMQDWWD